jgi:hypothetical protein
MFIGPDEKRQLRILISTRGALGLDGSASLDDLNGAAHGESRSGRSDDVDAVASRKVALPSLMRLIRTPESDQEFTDRRGMIGR